MALSRICPSADFLHFSAKFSPIVCGSISNYASHAHQLERNFLKSPVLFKNTILKNCFSNGLSNNYVIIAEHWKNKASYSTASTGFKPESSVSPKKAKVMDQDEWIKMSKKERLKIIIRDYGKTVIAFHITISLISLGAFYSLVSYGIDVKPLVDWLVEEESMGKIMGQSSTFLISYAIHKAFAPVRIGITIGVAPILVRYFRRKGILKPPKSTQTA